MEQKYDPEHYIGIIQDTINRVHQVGLRIYIDPINQELVVENTTAGKSSKMSLKHMIDSEPDSDQLIPDQNLHISLEHEDFGFDPFDVDPLCCNCRYEMEGYKCLCIDRLNDIKNNKEKMDLSGICQYFKVAKWIEEEQTKHKEECK